MLWTCLALELYLGHRTYIWALSAYFGHWIHMLGLGCVISPSLRVSHSLKVSPCFLKILGSYLRSGGLNGSLFRKISIRIYWKYSWTPKPANNRNEGFPLAAYLIPGRDGMGAWPNSKIVRAGAASVTNTSKTTKSSNNKNLTIGP